MEQERLDILDVGQGGERYADVAGLPPDLVRPQDKRDELRAARARRQGGRQQQGAALARPPAGAKDSRRRLARERTNALTRIIGGMGPAAAARPAPRCRRRSGRQ